jgi:hypothetical protein
VAARMASHSKKRNGVEYKFDDEEDNDIILEQPAAAPFQDIPAEAPGMLTKTYSTKYALQR